MKNASWVTERTTRMYSFISALDGGHCGLACKLRHLLPLSDGLQPEIVSRYTLPLPRWLLLGRFVTAMKMKPEGPREHFSRKNCHVFHPFSYERRYRKYKIEQVGESRGLVHQRVLSPPPPLGHSWERWCELRSVHLIKAASQLLQFCPVGLKRALWMGCRWVAFVLGSRISSPASTQLPLHQQPQQRDPVAVFQPDPDSSDENGICASLLVWILCLLLWQW